MAYRRQALLNLGIRLAVQELVIPAAEKIPQFAGSYCSQRLWAIHFFALCAANPKASFCCVSSASDHGAKDALSTVASGESLENQSLKIVPARFSPDAVAGLSIRPSSTATPTDLTGHWISTPEQIIIEGTTLHAGVQLLEFRRQSDGLKFFGAKDAIAAQAAAAELGQRSPLWNALMKQRAGLGNVVFQAFS